MKMQDLQIYKDAGLIEKVLVQHYQTEKKDFIEILILIPSINHESYTILETARGEPKHFKNWNTAINEAFKLDGNPVCGNKYSLIDG